MTNRFLVETIYHQVYVSDQSNGEKDTKIVSHLVSFEGENRASVLQDAKNFMEKTLRHGLDLAGGSIVKSTISPSCIIQVGIIDEALAQQEAALRVEADGASVPSDVEEVAETAPVDSEEVTE